MLAMKKCVLYCSRSSVSMTRVMSSSSLSDFKAWNEPMFDYGPGSEERAKLEAAIKQYDGQVTDIPIVIGGEEIRTSDVRYQVAPFDHQKKIAKYHYASADLVQKAIDSSLKARKEWERKSFDERAQVFLKAADLVGGTYRMDLLATTMLGQAKTIFQAEIDAAAELADFYRFNVHFGLELQKVQPVSPSSEITNKLNFRGMEGFWAAISPFNFTAIGGHLPVGPAIVGNVSVWKPSDTAMLSNWTVFRVLREAGLPPGVINFVPADGPVFGDTVTSSPDLCGINFTGSVRTFRHLWKQVGQNIDNYKTYPRLIGECGGKNYHLIHSSADAETVAVATYKAAFEFGGQKCSACSRLYIPQSMWPKVKQLMLDIHKDVTYGSPLDYKNFLSAVIDEKSFDRIKGWLDHAKSSPNLTVIAGGDCDKKKGYFVQPTIVETTDPKDPIMQEEIFGPVLTVYVYPDDKIMDVARLVDSTTVYSLTGSIFSKDRQVTEQLLEVLRDAAGNVYLNDKCTGSVVGQQPFGGTRLSGTNDKAGGPHYLLKFASPQAMKESKVEQRGWRYPSMDV